jgi:hypothetical protein
MKNKRIRVLVSKVIHEVIEVDADTFNDAYHKVQDGYGNPEVVASKLVSRTVDPTSVQNILDLIDEGYQVARLKGETL